MNRSEWMDWLASWLQQHPVRAPSEHITHAYADEVMRRIRAADAPAPSFRPAMRPRLAWVLAPVTVCAIALAVVLPRIPARLARSIERDWQMLEQVEEDAGGSKTGASGTGSDEALLEELRWLDQA